MRSLFESVAGKNPVTHVGKLYNVRSVTDFSVPIPPGTDPPPPLEIPIEPLGSDTSIDQVIAQYYESVAFEVKRKGQATPGVAVAEGVTSAELGEMPAATGVAWQPLSSPPVRNSRSTRSRG